MSENKRQLIEECAKLLSELPKEEVLKFLYMAKGVAVVHKNKIA